MSDPDSQVEPTPPPQPPRPAQPATGPTSTAHSQLLADEQYARQLAEHYSGAAAYGGDPRTGQRGRQDLEHPRPRQEMGLKPNELYDDREHSFIDGMYATEFQFAFLIHNIDDLPVIRDNIKKGFLETQSKVNSWVANLRKKLDGQDEEEYQNRPVQTSSSYNRRPSPQQYSSSRRSGDSERRSVDRNRYDADPQVLGDDFANLQMRDHEGKSDYDLFMLPKFTVVVDPPRRSTRPLANPDLFKPTPVRPHSGDRRRVSFQEGPPEEIDTPYRASPDPTKRPTSGGGKTSKWQPLSAVDPSPVADHDPFSLGDSDDEDAKKKEVREDDSHGLKPVALEPAADETGVPGRRGLEPHETSGIPGTGNKEADKVLGGKS